jgi:hypothetical protein
MKGEKCQKGANIFSYKDMNILNRKQQRAGKVDDY